MITAVEVAEWMNGELRQHGILYQQEVAYLISERFGEEFTYLNNKGNIAIGKTVLTAFRSLTEGIVVWERGERCWRMREPHDQPGRRQN